MRCTACGTENRPGSRFCDNCGTPLEASCPSCGAPNRSDARFCSSCGSALGDAAPRLATTREGGGAGAERRLVSVLFADLVGFTTLAEDRDPEAVRELLSRYFDTATAVIGLHGGTIEKFIGDAVMAAWTRSARSFARFSETVTSPMTFAPCSGWRPSPRASPAVTTRRIEPLFS